MTISVITDFPVAYDSDDHKYPEGTWMDNSLHIPFVDEVETTFSGRKINFMDLGCAGGQLVVEMHNRGHIAVGLEGSDHSISPSLDMVKKMGCMPAGYSNWLKYGRDILHTCDVTKDYTVVMDENPLQFDLISCWDVMEHFYPEQIGTFCSMVSKHLKPGGLFIATIALFSSGKNHGDTSEIPETLDYHKSIFPKSWWRIALEHYFDEMRYPFVNLNRAVNHEVTYIYCGRKKA